VKQSGGPARI